LIGRHKTLSLLALFCVVVGVILYIDYEVEEKAVEKRERKGQLFNFEVNEVVSLAFHDRDTDLTVVLEKLDQGWVMEEPIKAKADQNTIDNLLNSVADYRKQHLISDERSDWEEFGVDERQRSRSINWRLQDATSFELILGHDTPVGFGVYFRTNKSDAIYSGSQYIVTATANTLGDFRDKSIVQIQPELVRRLAYLVNGELLAEFAYEQGRYHFTHPMGLNADHSAVARLLTDTVNAKAAEFVDEPSPAFKREFRNAGHKISVAWYGDPAHKEANGSVVLATMDNLFWARNDLGQYFRVSADTMRSLTKHLKDFRHRAIIGFQASEIAAVDVNEVRFVKEADEEFYRIEEGVIGKKQYPHIANLLMDLIFARTQDFLDRSAGEFASILSGPPDVIVRLQFHSELSRDDTHVRVWSHPTEGHQRLVEVTGQPNLFLLRASDLSNAHAGLGDGNRN